MEEHTTESANFTCPICYIEKPHKYKAEECGHVFCITCIMSLQYFVGDVASCPLCRKKIYITKRKISIPPYNPNNYPIESNLDSAEYTSAYNTITKENKWEMLHDYTVDENRGFMLTSDKNICNLMSKINDDYGGGHSGLSMAITMRAMHFIAQFGLEHYKIIYEIVNNKSKK